MPPILSALALRRRADEASRLMKLLSHPNRLMVACELRSGEKSVSELEAATGAIPSNLSRDLARMRAEGLVATRREAKHVFYRLADDRLARVIDALCAAYAPIKRKSGRKS
jgi:ArsR family transcriptional regulator